MRKHKLKYHYLYKTTNVINGKYYIGIHSTYNIKDGYLGSGTQLWNAIYKYGKENFIKKELEFFETREELLQREKEIVNEQLINDHLCMNLKPGGSGGFTSRAHAVKASLAGLENRLKKLKWLRENDLKWVEKCSKSNSLAQLETYKNGRIGLNNWKGKKIPKEAKRKIGIANSISQKGEKNSQFGTMWITNGIENKKIKKEDFKQFEKLNWKKGRIVIRKRKLNEQQINEIKYSKDTTKNLSKKYNVSSSTIKRIRSNKGY